MKLETFQEQLLFLQDKFKDLSKIRITAHPDNNNSLEIILVGKFSDLLEDLNTMVNIVENTDNDEQYFLLADIAFNVTEVLGKTTKHEFQKMLVGSIVTHLHLIQIEKNRKKYFLYKQSKTKTKWERKEKQA